MAIFMTGDNTGTAKSKRKKRERCVLVGARRNCYAFLINGVLTNEKQVRRNDLESSNFCPLWY